MKFTFEQTKDDIIDLYSNMYRSSKLIKYVGIGFLIIVLVNVAMVLMNEGVGTTTLIKWLYPIVLFTFLWYFLFKFLMKRRLSDPDNKDLLIGSRTIELSENQIVMESPLSKSEVSWSAISKFQESKKAFYLYLGKSQAIILPKRIFKSDEKINEFKKLVNSKVA